MKQSIRVRAMKIGAATAASGLAVVLLAGCGSDTDSGNESASPAPTQSETSPAVGGDPGTWTPVAVTAEMNGDTLEMVPNQAANFEGFPESAAGYYVTSSDEMVVQGTNSLDATTVPGFRALATGTATVTLWDGDPNATDEAAKGQPIVEVTVVVEAAAEVDMDDTSSESGM